MARISKNNIKSIRKERVSIHSIVDCNYLLIKDGNKTLLQLETLGNKGRQNVDKPSQVIQVDEETLKYLLSLFGNSNKAQY